MEGFGELREVSSSLRNRHFFCRCRGCIYTDIWLCQWECTANSDSDPRMGPLFRQSSPQPPLSYLLAIHMCTKLLAFPTRPWLKVCSLWSPPPEPRSSRGKSCHGELRAVTQILRWGTAFSQPLPWMYIYIFDRNKAPPTAPDTTWALANCQNFFSKVSALAMTGIRFT